MPLFSEGFLMPLFIEGFLMPLLFEGFLSMRFSRLLTVTLVELFLLPPFPLSILCGVVVRLLSILFDALRLLSILWFALRLFPIPLSCREPPCISPLSHLSLMPLFATSIL